MSLKTAPTKVKIKKPSNVVSINDRESHNHDSVNNKSIDQDTLNTIKHEQRMIDEYNESIVQIDSYFTKLQLHGQYLVVRLYRENFIKYIDESNPDDVKLDAYVRMIDGRERATDEPIWVFTPFPYIERGVICAVSPELVLRYAAINEQLRKNNLPEIKIPEIGDFCNIRARTADWYKERRYYIDKQKQCQDFVRNQKELRLKNFEGYFLVEDHDLESIDK